MANDVSRTRTSTGSPGPLDGKEPRFALVGIHKSAEFQAGHLRHE
jgi:hypothetical protein